MKWYHYITAFFAGAFLANTIPHLVHGISGDWFPSPFADPPGKGNSSPTLNVLWACFNLWVGYVLLRVCKATWQNRPALLLIFIGFVAMSIMLSVGFQDKMPAHPPAAHPF